MRDSFADQTEDLTAPDDLLAQLELTHQICATKIRSFLESVGDRKTDVSAALATNDWSEIRPLSDCPTTDITAVVSDLNTKAAEFERVKSPEKLAELKAERDQLLVRQRLG